MINPSANGWIKKFFSENKSNYKEYNNDLLAFYHDVRTSGFIYGYVIRVNLIKQLDTKLLSSDEITKIALLNSLFSVFKLVTKTEDEKVFNEKAIEFYTFLYQKGNSLFSKSKPNLEECIATRIQTNENVFAKNFSHIITNALLFMDILAFQKYLETFDNPLNYLKKLEESTIVLVSNALSVKENPSQYDNLLVKLFENSVRYTKFYRKQVEVADLEQFEKFDSIIEKLYLLDLATMAMWSDDELSIIEKDYLHKFCSELHIEENEYVISLNNIDTYIKQYRNEIPYFNYSNPVKHFYEQSNKTVTKLITRNGKRLTKELKESKELVRLLAKSATTDLDKEEKKKVKKQLLDICKTIPSLTIFLLPGGGLLLPILIKYIPQLLPSAFNENLEE
ncbi:LETM1-related biofilm-associated protein [Flavobacterium gelidilacus]|uniref:LETM1-related biofilm-associated protein n=1 Tax=Flavobacterium gelidilacus TaxID=206041 RepID=UPI0004041B00|nr:LETM1-related biofilm-associated protein [Flavobacterium gelidilacus]